MNEIHISGGLMATYQKYITGINRAGTSLIMSPFVRRYIAIVALAISMVVPRLGLAATTLLPEPMQCFQNSAGPLAGGTILTSVPGGGPKTTWMDALHVTANTNPIALDSNGCAIIYGIGSYEFVVKDSLGNLIYDQVTADTSSNNATFWAGQASGTPNVITVVDAGFNGTDGSVINFIPLFNNTGPTTLNPSSFGAIPIVKDTTGGPVALVGGEIIATTGGVPNIVSVLYSATQNNFHLLNTAIPSASGATAPLCGATGLNITNNASTPNTIITVTAGSVVMLTPAGLVINRSNVSININISTGTSTAAANGMDGEAVGTNRWLNIFLIDNGAAPAGLTSVQSGNGLTPTMPSGYSYKCRLGAMSVDGSGNLFKQLLVGSVGHWVGGAAAGQVTCQVASGTQGTYSATAPALASVSAAGDTFCVPATATAVNAIGTTNWKGAGGSNILVAPSAAYSGANNGPQGSNGIVYPIWSTATNSQSAWITLESVNLFLASSGAGGAFYISDWKDDVNAN
jgi:hypothetical protein